VAQKENLQYRGNGRISGVIAQTRAGYTRPY
jgi:hypothetical protein